MGPQRHRHPWSGRVALRHGRRRGARVPDHAWELARYGVPQVGSARVALRRAGHIGRGELHLDTGGHAECQHDMSRACWHIAAHGVTLSAAHPPRIDRSRASGVSAAGGRTARGDTPKVVLTVALGLPRVDDAAVISTRRVVNAILAPRSAGVPARGKASPGYGLESFVVTTLAHDVSGPMPRLALPGGERGRTPVRSPRPAIGCHHERPCAIDVPAVNVARSRRRPGVLTKALECHEPRRDQAHDPP